MGIMNRKLEKRLSIEKQVNEIMSSKYYKERMKSYESDFTLNALVKLCYITCEYLESKHKYKKKGLEKFLDFVSERVDELKTDERYFKDSEYYYNTEYGLQILSKFGLKLIDNEEEK